MIKSILAIIEHFLKWFTSDRQETKRTDAEVEKRKRKTIEAINNKNEDEVNKILRRNLGIITIGLLTIIPGCASKCPAPVFIPAEDKVQAIEWQGRPGWFVPDNVFKSIMLKLEEKGK